MGTIQKILTTGVGAALMTENSLRNVLSDIRLTQQVKDYIARQILKARGEISKALLNELKKFLDHLDLDHEIRKALSGLTFQVQATVQLVPEQSQSFKESTAKMAIGKLRAHKKQVY